MPTGYKQARDNMNDTANIVNTHNGHEFVDLGLPSGTLWATCNVGATSPEQAGLYFAFGETTGYTAEQVTSGMRKFNKASYKETKIKSDLRREQDAAHIHMGGNWRMPTKAEYKELIGKCDSAWTNNYNETGMAGSIFTSKVNGNSVFFPAAGLCDNSYLLSVGSYGYYWSASWHSSSLAWGLDFYVYDQFLEYYHRFFWCSVRGVCK